MYKISDFLSGQVAISVDGSVITAACLGRDVMPDDEFMNARNILTTCRERSKLENVYYTFSDVAEETRQLVLADMLMILCRGGKFSNRTASEAFSLSLGGSLSDADRKALRNDANAIYAKYEPASMRKPSVINIYSDGEGCQ